MGCSFSFALLSANYEIYVPDPGIARVLAIMTYAPHALAMYPYEYMKVTIIVSHGPSKAVGVEYGSTGLAPVAEIDQTL